MSRRKKFVLWLNKFYHVQNKITICILYTFIMAVLGVIIYGATHQQASTNMSVTYTRPFYTVNFDANGGSLTTSTGGGAASKQVRLGDPYGDLPIPTKAGYTFIGWRGRNIIDVNRYSLFDCGESFTIVGNTVTLKTRANPATDPSSEGTVTIPIEDLTIGKYFFSGELVSRSETATYNAVVTMGRRSDNNYARVVAGFSYSQGNTFFNYTGKTEEGSSSIAFASGEFYVGVVTNYGAPFEAASVTIKNLMLAKVSSENEKIGYEPYFIQRDTIFATPSDCTLTAVWSANSNNLLTNGNFEDVYTQTDTGWDNSINGTLHARDWGDYNSGVVNAATVTHAHLKDISSTDPQHGHVFELRWDHADYLAASYSSYDNNETITAGTYRVTMSLKGVSGDNILTSGLYYYQTSGGELEFYSGRAGIRFGTTDWFRFTYTFTITKIYAFGRLFFYGCSWGANEQTDIDTSGLAPSPNNIFYLDDVFFEKIA